MKTQFGVAVLGALTWVLSYPGPAVALDVTLDSGGSGSVTLTDTDMDHVIDFDLMVGDVFRAKGRVVESLGAISRIVTITSTPPDSEAIFGRIGVGAGTAAYTVTVNTTSFAATGSPLGWNVVYDANADDALAGPVDIPSHSVTASVNAGTVPLTTLTGAPLTMASSINLETSGANPSDSATDVRIVFTFTPGPDDEIRLPDNNGFDGKAIEVDVFNQSAKCVDQMNNRARRVGQLAGKNDSKCVKKGTGDVTACVDDPAEPKTDKQEQKLIEKFADTCAPVPAWGVNGSSCCEGGANDGAPCLNPTACTPGTCTAGACISAAAEAGAGAITHDLFGAAVNVSSDRDTAKCQAKVIQSAGKLYTGRWKAVRKCKKDNFLLIASDADLISVCLGPPQTDAKNFISSALGKLIGAVQSKCVGNGVSPVGGAFPGVCTAAADVDFAGCVDRRVACRFCQAINVADAIVPPLDCDLFDDGGSNASCP
jgi:hypothetical protein